LNDSCELYYVPSSWKADNLNIKPWLKILD
jgi:hypothetical protein